MSGKKVSFPSSGVKENLILSSPLFYVGMLVVGAIARRQRRRPFDVWSVFDAHKFAA